MDAWIEAQSYNYEELYFNGWLNFRDQTVYYAYVNEKIYDDTDSPFDEWRYMNLCEKICTGMRYTWDAGFTIAGLFGGGLGAVIMCHVNDWFWDYTKENVCI